jgi:hypothetical protein
MSEVQAYDVQSFAKAYGISRAQIYIEIKAGRLRIFKVGRRTLISCEAAEAWRRGHEEAMAVRSADNVPTMTMPDSNRKGSSAAAGHKRVR